MTEYSPVQNATIDSFTASLNDVCEKNALGADSIELCKDFWERFAKIQLAHAKNLEDLCASRQAKLTKLFGTGTSCEPVASIDAAWAAFVKAIERNAAQHRDVAAVATTEIIKDLTTMRAEGVTHQLNKGLIGKKVLRDLKSEESRVLAEEKKYHDTCRKVIVAASTKSPSYATLQQQQASEESAYKQALANFESAARTTFSISLPGLLSEMQELEVKRVDVILRSVKRGLTLLVPVALDLVEAHAAADATTPDTVNTCAMSLEHVPVHTFKELPSEESRALAGKATKVEKKAVESKGFFASLFAADPAPAKSAAPAASATTDDGESVRSQTPPMLNSESLPEGTLSAPMSPATSAVALVAESNVVAVQTDGDAVPTPSSPTAVAIGSALSSTEEGPVGVVEVEKGPAPTTEDVTF